MKIETNVTIKSNDGTIITKENKHEYILIVGSIHQVGDLDFGSEYPIRMVGGAGDLSDHHLIGGGCYGNTSLTCTLINAFGSDAISIINKEYLLSGGDIRSASPHSELESLIQKYSYRIVAESLSDIRKHKVNSEILHTL